MKSSLLLSALLLSGIAIVCKAQIYKPTELGVKAKINATEIEIQFYSTFIARVVKYPEGKPFVKQSLSVIQMPQKKEFSIKQQGKLGKTRAGDAGTDRFDKTVTYSGKKVVVKL